MKMAMKDGKIMLIEVDNTQMAIIKSWNSMKYDRRKNMMIGDCSKELLDKLSKIVRLPPAIESYRQRLDETQRAVDKMRVEKEPEALVKYPVQGSLYEHQVRAANMALLTFGLADPKEVLKSEQEATMTYDEIIEQLEITKSKIKEIARNEYGGESWNDDLDALTEAADIVADYSKATAQASEMSQKYEQPAMAVRRAAGLYTCPLCGKRTQVGHTHCHWCGKKLSWDREAYTDRDYPHMSTKGGRRR